MTWSIQSLLALSLVVFWRGMRVQGPYSVEG